jgi:KorB domain
MEESLSDADTATETTAAKMGGRDFMRKFAKGRAGEVFYFPSNMFRPGDHNHRDWTLPANLAEIVDLANTINLTSADPKDHIHDPVVVMIAEDDSGLVDITFGETRWRAVLYLEGKEYAPGHKLADPVVTEGTIKLPTMLGKKMTRAERVFANATQQGRGYKDLELAEAFHDLIETEGWTQAEIAKRYGTREQTFVSQILGLRNADPRVREAIASGHIASTTVLNTYRRFKATPEIATKAILNLVAEAQAEETAEADVLKTGGRSARGRTRNVPRSKPKRVTQNRVLKEIGAEIVATETPHAGTAANFEIARVAIVHEARYSASTVTRDNMNAALKRFGLYPEPCLVDDKGEELPNVQAILDEHMASRTRQTGVARRGTAKVGSKKGQKAA